MNNNETVLKFKEMKKPETISVIKDATTEDGVKEEILKVIEFKDNIISKEVGENVYKAENPIAEDSIKEPEELTESGSVENASGAIEIPNVEETPDYVMTNLCDIKDQEPGFVKHPRDEIDISNILARVDADLTESQGIDYGTINVLFTRSAKDRLSESSLLEYRTRGKVYTLALSITEGSKEGYYKFRVNNTLGKKIFERETKKPAMLIESYFKAINFKVLAEQCLLSKQELNEAATPILTTIKRFLKKENCEGLVNITTSNGCTVTMTSDDTFLSSYGTEAAWTQFENLYNLIKSGFPNANVSDIQDGSFTFQEK